MTGPPRSATYRERLESCLLHDALAILWEYVGDANKVVDAEQPWVLAKAWKAGDEAAGERLRGVLGDLVEACRLVGLAAAPFLPGTAPRLLAQLGHAYPYGPDGNGGPPILDELAGAPTRRGGREFIAAANKLRRRRSSRGRWQEAAKAGDATAADRLRNVLGDLSCEACRRGRPRDTAALPAG